MSTRLFRFVMLISISTLFIEVSAQDNRMRNNVNAKSKDVPAPYITVYDSYMVDVQPEFPGGEGAMIKFINDTRHYPAEAYDQRVQGRVVCSFIVNADGTISYISVIKGVEESLDKEAVRIISQMPKWVAGQLNGKAVSVYCILPIPFRL